MHQIVADQTTIHRPIAMSTSDTADPDALDVVEMTEEGEDWIVFCHPDNNDAHLMASAWLESDDGEDWA